VFYITLVACHLFLTGAVIDLINNEQIKFSCHIIVGKLMQHYTKGECSLDAIYVAKSYNKGEKLNWSNFMLSELFETCKDVYKCATCFIFGYLVILLAIMKWCDLDIDTFL